MSKKLDLETKAHTKARKGERLTDEEFEAIDEAPCQCGASSAYTFKLEARRARESEAAALDLLDTYDLGGSVLGWVQAVRAMLTKAGRR
jgi:hypothetical protein